MGFDGAGESSLYVRAWIESIGSIVGELLGPGSTASRMASSDFDVKMFDGADVGIMLRFEAAGALTGDQVLFLPSSDAKQLAAIAGLPAAPLQKDVNLPEPHREKLTQVLSHCGEEAADMFSRALGGEEVEFRFAGTSGPMLSPTALVAVEVKGATRPPIHLYLMVSAELEKALRQMSGPSASASSSFGAGARGLVGRLMEAELEVALRFGARELLLKDVLELGPGAVVELDHQVDDPVELLVSGKVFARGQVVVADGNYGLRVTEIASPRQRAEVLGK